MPLFLAFSQLNDDSDYRLETFDGDGVLQGWLYDSPVFRVVRDELADGFIVCRRWDADPSWVGRDLTHEWTWDRPANNNLTWDAAPAGGRAAYLLFPWNDETRIYHVAADGTGTLLTSLTPAQFDMQMVQAETLCLSPDGAVLVVGLLDPVDEDGVVLAGIATADGSLLWQLQVSDADLPYSGWEIWGTTVRWLPGAHAVILAYDSLDADTGWSLPQVSRFDFGAYTEAPTLAWNVQPSARGTYLSGLDVRADGIYVAYGACDDPSRQEHLASRLDPDDGSTVWSYGQPHYADDWAYVEHHGIAVADDRVLLCVAVDYQAFPDEGWGLMMLDAATGERVDSGDMPRETYWSYGVAGLADEPEPGPEPGEPVTVNPAAPPPTASYDCAAPNAVAVEWCANPPPEYSDPAVPWPMAEPEPEPNEPGVFVMAHRPKAADENITWTDGEGVITSDIASRYSVREMVAHGEGLVTFLATEMDDSSVQGVGRWGPDGEVWWWELPASATVIDFITALALGANDATYFSARTEGGGIDVWRVEPDGSGGSKVLTVTTADTGGRALGTRLAGAESRGGDIYYVLASPAAEMDNPILVGIDMMDHYVLFAQEVVPPEGQRSIFGSNVSLKRLTNGNDLVAAFPTWDQDAAITSVLVTRLDFGSRPFDAPSVDWQERLFSASSTTSGSACYLAVTSKAVVIGHMRLGTGSDKPDGAPVTCLEANDGSERWRFVDTMECENGQVVAVSGDRVLVQVFDAERFPGNEWPYGYGYVMLDLETGEEVTDGVFPYQTRYADACAAIHVEESGGIITS